MKKLNLITELFQSITKKRDIREYKKNIFYYIFFRLFRNFFNSNIEIKIENFKVIASYQKNKTSHALLKKCNFDDQSELMLIKKFSKNKKIFLLDCGCNYGFYSFFTASLSRQNSIISIEASPTTSEEFKKNLILNNFNNVTLKNFAISDTDDLTVILNESENDWESSLNHKKFKNIKSTKVKTCKIDTLLYDFNLENYFLFIKLDIEGNELQAIKGATNIIRKYNPIFIIELSKYIFENNYDNFIFFKFFLKEFDYDIYDINKNYISPDEIINLLKNLDINHKTIGNYYLVKNNKDIKELFKSE
ncbi:FkbM family methyltransferase [Candidatus Pelagibacter sp.]|nr:FkbM family methyltransferase [Candidatus Pelagibacter sp.]